MKEPGREALRWFLQAEDDLRFVEWVLREGIFFDKGCFIAQQAGGKALKACLYGVGMRRVFGHSLYEMTQELARSDERFAGIRSQAKRLDRFYITARYPNGIPGGSPFQVYERDDLAGACEDLGGVFTLCRNFLEERGMLQSK